MTWWFVGLLWDFVGLKTRPGGCEGRLLAAWDFCAGLLWEFRTVTDEQTAQALIDGVLCEARYRIKRRARNFILFRVPGVCEVSHLQFCGNSEPMPVFHFDGREAYFRRWQESDGEGELLPVCTLTK